MSQSPDTSAGILFAHLYRAIHLLRQTLKTGKFCVEAVFDFRVGQKFGEPAAALLQFGRRVTLEMGDSLRLFSSAR